MNIASIQPGESVDDLARRVYAFREDPTAAQVRAAAAALSAANPVLRRISEVDPSTRVVVPPIPDAQPSPDTQTFERASVDAMLEGMRFLIGQATTALGDAIAQDLQETNASTAALRQRTVKSQSAGADGAALRQAVDAAAKQRVAAAKTLQAYHKRVLVRIEDDLNELQALLGG